MLPLTFHLCVLEVFNLFLLISSICAYIPDIKLLYSCKYFVPVSHSFSNLFLNTAMVSFIIKKLELFCIDFFYGFRVLCLILKGFFYSKFIVFFFTFSFIT